MLALRLPKDIEERLEALAKKTGRTKSFYAREAIIEKLADLELAYLALERLNDDPQYVDLDALDDDGDDDAPMPPAADAAE